MHFLLYFTISDCVAKEKKDSLRRAINLSSYLIKNVQAKLANLNRFEFV